MLVKYISSAPAGLAWLPNAGAETAATTLVVSGARDTSAPPGR